MRNNLRIIIIALGLILATAAYANSQTGYYVSDTFEITLRSGPTLQHKILRMVPTGSKLELIENQGEWALVKWNEIEGYVQTRFITTDLPKELVIKTLQRRTEQLEQKTSQATDQSGKLSAENKELKAALEKTSSELARIQQEYASLRSDAAGVFELKKNYEDTRAKLEAMSAEAEQLKAVNKELRSDATLRWFTAGAGIVVFSWLVGFILGRSGRKRKSMLYG